jgi:hypothetical protein
MTNSSKNQKLLYQEICSNRQAQQSSVDYINTKLSWVIAANITLLGLVSFISQQDWYYVSAGLFWASSLIVSIFSINTHRYKFGPKLSAMEKKSKELSYTDFIGATNRKIIRDIDKNAEKVYLIGKLLRCSIYLLIVGVLFFITPYILVFIEIFCKVLLSNN